MAKTRYIDTRFWHDTFIREHLNPLDRYLFLYFLTNDKTNISGIYELPMSIISNETGIESETIIKMLKRLEGKIHYVDGWIYVINFQRYQNTENPKIKRGIEIELSKIPSKIRLEIKKLNKILKIKIPYGYPMDRLSHSNSNSNSNSNNISSEEDGSLIVKKKKMKTYNEKNFSDQDEPAIDIETGEAPLIPLKEKKPKETQPHIKLAIAYVKSRKFEYKNEKDYWDAVFRYMKPAAKLLRGHKGVEILECMKWCEKKYPEWSLETVAKKIDEYKTYAK